MQLHKTKKERSCAQRLMSPATQSRWYRAPEVILTEAYSESIDIWSAGIVLGELIRSTDKYEE